MTILNPMDCKKYWKLQDKTFGWWVGKHRNLWERHRESGTKKTFHEIQLFGRIPLKIIWTVTPQKIQQSNPLFQKGFEEFFSGFQSSKIHLFFLCSKGGLWLMINYISFNMTNMNQLKLYKILLMSIIEILIYFFKYSHYQVYRT